MHTVRPKPNNLAEFILGTVKPSTLCSEGNTSISFISHLKECNLDIELATCVENETSRIERPIGSMAGDCE